MKRQQFVHRPAMVGDPRGHGRRRLLRMGQTRMRRAKVIDRTHQEHPFVQRQGLAGQRPATTHQWREAFPERRVQSLNVRGIDHAVPLRPAAERLHACRRAIDNAAVGCDHPSPLVPLDNLGDQDIAPGAQPWPPARARVHGIAKGLPNRPDGGHQAIGTDQQGTTCRTAPHPLDQPPDQGQVALLTDLAAQPQARRDHHGQRHPHDATLFLDAELIGLHLPQVPGLFDQILVHGLALAPRACPPVSNRPLVKPKSCHDRLHGTPMGEQRHHEAHRLGRGAQAVKRGAFGGAERLMALMADEPLFLLRMDTDIAHACLTSGRAVPIGAKYRRGIHAMLLLAVCGSVPRGVCRVPIFVTSELHHG
jgi:hypothetical protein